ncbi:MAG: cysteine desulfurase CsdA [Acidiferrobacteraceae bacterium]|nr:cysteine desulfurase CsdA [Acidiferrobacteraceae bacterium]|tara:strand:+ start:1410 stop:2681 length:1272 start_codon:yes stop_codon:yes gene_type:complete
MKNQVVSQELSDQASELTLDVDSVRNDFPVLHQEVHGCPLVYLDNGASSQKPEVVIQKIAEYYSEQHSNVHRGVHTLSQRATDLYEEVRENVRSLINARSTREIIYVRGTTEAINLVAFSYGMKNMQPGDEILITEMEHHSNIVPWQLLCERSGATLKIVPINDQGELIMKSYEELLTNQTKIVAVTHVSNALGTVNPVAKITEMAHAAGAVVLIDGAQGVPHKPIDVQAIGCDFYAFSGHKIYGPTGVGVLYGREVVLEEMPPWQGGGDMIKQVRLDGSEYNDLPYKFEAGTPNIAGVIGLGTAIEYVMELGLNAINKHESLLLDYALTKAEQQSGLRVIGSASERASLLSFVLDGVHPHDVGTVLDHEGVAVRAGHHCAMPVMEHFGVPATVRASWGIYNTYDELDRLFEGIDKVQELFRK